MGLRVRPVVTLAERDQKAIWGLTDRRGLNADEIEMCPEVYLTFVYPNENVYLALAAEAFVSVDREHVRELWERMNEVWWSGPDDPSLLVMRLELWRAEMWDGPVNCSVADFQFTKARLFGTKANPKKSPSNCEVFASVQGQIEPDLAGHRFIVARADPVIGRGTIRTNQFGL